MIRIRYRDSHDFPPGLHAAAERHGRTTTLYLLPGLTVPERRSVLRRLRLSARMGHCPRLPAAQLAIALLADWVRTATGRAGAVFRLHSAGSTVPVMVLSGGAIAFLLLSTVSIRVLPSPGTGAPPLTAAAALPAPGSSPSRAAGLAGPEHPGRPGRGPRSVPLTEPGPPSPPSPPRLADGDGDGDGDADNWAGSRGGTSTSTSTGTTPSEHADPTQAPGTTRGSSAICVNVDPLGVCLTI